MARKPLVAIDVDDVLLAQNFDYITDHLNAVYSENYIPDNWYSLEKLVEVYGKSEKEIVAAIHTYLDSQKFQELTPAEDSIRILKKLTKRFSFVVITARPGISHVFTEKWIEKHFPGVFSDVHFVNIAYAWGSKMHHTASKSNVCQNLGAEYLIDDALHHIQEAAECGVRGLLFGDYSWNQTDELPENVVRVKDWHEVEKVLLNA